SIAAPCRAVPTSCNASRAAARRDTTSRALFQSDRSADREPMVSFFDIAANVFEQHSCRDVNRSVTLMLDAEFSAFCRPDAPRRAASSICVSVRSRREHGPKHDPQIEPERPVVDVIEIVLDAVAHLLVGVGFAAETVNLRPPRDSRPDVVPTGVERDAPLVVM